MGGIDFSRDIGDTVPIKRSLCGLSAAGNLVRCFRLVRQEVVELEPPAFRQVRALPQGAAGWRVFRTIERGLRRLQRALGLPYYAVVDSYRFYTACRMQLKGFDLCHEHNGLFSVGTALACRKLGLPYVLTFSADLMLERAAFGKPLKGLHARAARTGMAYSLQQAQAVLCVSEAARRHLIDHWRVKADKIAVFPNGVDTGLFRPIHGDPDNLRGRYGLGDGPVISFVGGFQPWHGLELLVEAFAAVLEEMPHARLLLVGDGRSRPAVDAAVEAHGVADCVTVTGFVPQAEVPGLLGISDVAVMPYPPLPQELWFSPLKMFEYMSAGKAIVASRSGQIVDIIQDGQTGVLVKPGDTAELSRAILQLLANADERARLGGNARRQALERYSWDRYVEHLETVYKQVLEKVPVGRQAGD